MKRVLVADNTKSNQAMLSGCLEAEGFEAVSCGDGKTAVDLVLREAFDLILLEIRLPLIVGTEVLRKIRESGINVPVIIMTAHPNIHNAIECTKLGAAVYIKKPFTANRILGILDSIGLRGGARSSALITEAQTMYEKNRYNEVEKILKNMLPDDTLNPEIYRMLAKVKAKQNKYAESEMFYKLYGSIRKMNRDLKNIS